MHHPTYLMRINTQTHGKRYDITPLFADYDALRALIQDLAEPFRAARIDLVAGIDAMGFILGTALAIELQKGFLAVRKGGKLTVPSDAVEFVDSSGERKSLELRKDALQPGMRVLVVDEWIRTGTQVGATVALIERQGGVVAGIAAIKMDANEQTRPLRERYECHWVWRRQEHHGGA